MSKSKKNLCLNKYNRNFKLNQFLLNDKKFNFDNIKINSIIPVVKPKNKEKFIKIKEKKVIRKVNKWDIFIKKRYTNNFKYKKNQENLSLITKFKSGLLKIKKNRSSNKNWNNSNKTYNNVLYGLSFK